MSETASLVTLHVWTVPRSGIPRALLHQGLDRAHLKRTTGLRFAKSLGTGGSSFGVLDATPSRWALLAVWDSPAAARRFTASPTIRSWTSRSAESARLDLIPLSSKGRWSGQEPFGDPQSRETGGPVVVLTRARLKAGKAATFWRAVPPVAAALQGVPGLKLAFGVGEAPVGVQGTVSVWDDAAAIRGFAYQSPAHLDAIRRTPLEGWYAEELFARFALVHSVGSIGGQTFRGQTTGGQATGGQATGGQTTGGPRRHVTVTG